MGNTCDKFENNNHQEVTLFERIKALALSQSTELDEHASSVEAPCQTMCSYATQKKQKFVMKKCSAKILDTTLPHEKTPVPKEVKSIPLSMNDFKKFKYIENISKRYEFGDYLGQGAFGKVLKCTLKDTGNQFAIKIMEKEMVKKRKVFLQLLENELSILGSKCHPKIIRIVDLLEDNENYYIVSEIVEGGELFNRLRTLDAFTEDQAVNIIWQVMLGLNYLHL